MRVTWTQTCKATMDALASFAAPAQQAGPMAVGHDVHPSNCPDDPCQQGQKEDQRPGPVIPR